MPELVTEKRVRARKAHPCQVCGTDAIQPGTEYTRTTYVHDGRIYNWVSCDFCKALFQHVWEWALCPDDEGIGQASYIGWAEDTLAGWGDDSDREKAREFLDRAGVDHYHG